MTTKIFLVEDSAVTRSAVQSLLSRMDGLEVVGTASDGQSGVDGAKETTPDLVLMDIGLPGMNGIEATKLIRGHDKNIRVLIVTASKTEPDTCAAFAAGANGYIVKENMTPEKLEIAVRSVSNGNGWLDGLIAQYVLDIAVHAQNSRRDTEPLTDAERQTLEHVAHNPSCTDSACSVDPEFFQRLHRFSGQQKRS